MLQALLSVDYIRRLGNNERIILHWLGWLAPRSGDTLVFDSSGRTSRSRQIYEANNNPFEID
jgi:hypothetical protein